MKCIIYQPKIFAAANNTYERKARDYNLWIKHFVPSALNLKKSITTACRNVAKCIIGLMVLERFIPWYEILRIEELDKAKLQK